MKIYIVKWQNPEDNFTFGVFSTEELAKSELKKHLDHCEETQDKDSFEDYKEWFFIETLTVDKILIETE